jgi:hypothetical protein
MDAVNARLARGDQFFWLLLTLTVIASGAARMAGLKLQEDKIPQLTLMHSDQQPHRYPMIDRTPTASIRRPRLEPSLSREGAGMKKAAQWAAHSSSRPEVGKDPPQTAFR